MAQQVFSFSLILADPVEINSEIEDALFEAGCEDALLGTRCGVAYLDFDRRAKSLSDAIQTAIRDVHQAGFQVARVEPDDIVNSAEIARRTGRSRESIRQLVSGARGPGGFPRPVSSITKASPLWNWVEVAEWFSHTQPLAETLVEGATTIGKINAVLEARRRIPEISEFERLWRRLEANRGPQRRKAATPRK
jgi:hypothetical protein